VNRCNKYQVEWNEYGSNFSTNNLAVYDFTANGTCGIRKEYDAESAKKIMSSFLKGGMTSQGISGKSASILLTFANPVFPDAMDRINPIVQPKRNVFDQSNIEKIVRILGLMALISYMIVILFTWVFANIEGYVYFSAGEPVLSIKYLEWILGSLGIFVAVNYLQKELNEYNI
jgi:hypothetical protein